MRAPAILVLGVILGLAAPVAAQTTEVSKQCGCDMSAHPPGFDCHAYCCRVSGGSWCGAAQPGVDGGTAGALIQTFGDALGAYFQHKDQQKRAREQALQAQRAAELQRQIEAQRERERQGRLQFEKSKAETLAQMKGPRPDAVTMKDIGSEGAAQATRLRAMGLSVSARLQGLLEFCAEPSFDGGRRDEQRVASLESSGAGAVGDAGPRGPEFSRPSQGLPVEVGIAGLDDAGLRGFQLHNAELRRDPPDRIVDAFERALLRDAEYLKANDALDRNRRLLEDAVASGASAEVQRQLLTDVLAATRRLDEARAKVKVRR